MKIQELREKRRMTQEQPAAQLQLNGIVITQNCISRIERGKRVVADYVKYTAIALKVSADELLCEENQY